MPMFCENALDSARATRRVTIMRLQRFRVRTLMLAVAVVAFLIWGGMMGVRSYGYYGLTRMYAEQERSWRQIADRPNQPGGQQFRLQCAEYFEQLAGKYRRAMWLPWMPVAPDPHAPGYDLWLEQERRAKEVAGE